MPRAVDVIRRVAPKAKASYLAALDNGDALLIARGIVTPDRPSTEGSHTTPSSERSALGSNTADTDVAWRLRTATAIEPHAPAVIMARTTSPGSIATPGATGPSDQTRPCSQPSSSLPSPNGSRWVRRVAPPDASPEVLPGAATTRTAIAEFYHESKLHLSGYFTRSTT